MKLGLSQHGSTKLTEDIEAKVQLALDLWLFNHSNEMSFFPETAKQCTFKSKGESSRPNSIQESKTGGVLFLFF